MANLAAISLACGALTGGLSYISATRQIKKQMTEVNRVAAENGGKIMTGNGDEYMTPDQVKATFNKARLKSTATSAAMGTALTFALNYGLEMAAKFIKK